MIDRPLARSRASDRIFEDLRDRICAGEFARGDQLPTERELATSYGVSANTVRESIRALSLMGLVHVRHGSGAYVTGSATGVVGMSLSMLLRFEDVGLLDVVRLAGILHGYAASLAIDRAKDDDIAALAETIDAIDGATADELGLRIEQFLLAFVATTHDSLLIALCHTLDRVIITVNRDITASGSLDLSRDVASLRPCRLRMLDALRRRDRQGLADATAEYHAESAGIILAHPELRDVRLSDPRWAPLLSALT